MNHLTDRQRLLYDRLVTLGEWATNGVLPLCVLEIKGFGSFFRGKQRPQDVDLLIRVQRPDHLPEFDRFLQLIQTIHYHLDLDEQYESPHEAIRGLAAKKDRHVKDIAERDLKRFLRWIEPYSWKMLRHQSIQQELALGAPESYASRLIRKHLPNLNVIQFLNPDESGTIPPGLRCGFMVSVWTEEKPETAANLNELSTERSMKRNAGQELAYFEVQMREIQASVAYNEAVAELLKRIPKRRKKPACSMAWLNEFIKDHAELADVSAEAERAFNELAKFIEQERGTEVLDDDDMSLLKLANLVDQRRNEIKRLYVRKDDLEDLQGALTQFKSGAVATELKAEEHVVADMLSRGSNAVKARKAGFLRELGYPVDRVTKQMERQPERFRRW